MPGPITWRNVGSTVSNSGSASLMGNAQKSFDGGFGALQKVLDAQRSTNKDNFATGQQNTVADYLDRVARANSIEEVAGLQDDSQLEALRQQLTGQYRGQVRGAIDQRETGLIEQIGARQEFGDDQTNRDLRPQLQAAYAKLYNGDESGLADLQALGVADDGEALATGFGALDKASRLDIAQDNNARGWNQDARANQDQSFRNYERARIKDANELSDQADGILREAYQGAQNLPDGMNMSQYKRATQDALVKAGLDPTRAAELAGNLDGSLEIREQASALDTALVSRAGANLEQEYNIPTNEFAQGTSTDPAADANRVLADFADEDGRLFGSSDPEERLQFARESADLLRGTVEVDGIKYNVTPEILRGALAGVDEGLLDFRPEGAVKDYIKNSPGVQERFKQFQQYQVKRNALEASATDTTRDYSNAWFDKTVQDRAKRDEERAKQRDW